MTNYYDSKMHQQLQYIMNNDGSELAEAASGLDTFLEYVGFNEAKLIKVLEPIIKEHYESLKEEIAEQDANDYRLISEFSDANFLVEEKETKNQYYKIGKVLLDINGNHIIMTKPKSSYFKVVTAI